jgi:anhydro-N-acetylmuramic acid kinase
MPNAAAADRPRLIAGAMSGTSADGIDVAIVAITGTGLGMSAKLIRHHARPYDASLKQAIFALRGSGQVSLAELARVGREISLAYAACVNEARLVANLKSADLTAIAAHGQTLYHDPPNTIQWLDPALIAAETGCAVVSDFRRADCAAGGQGAPLVPFADYILFRHATKNRILLNIGGIANLTYIPAGASLDQIIAFDTGPGNCVSDDLCRTHAPAGPGLDENGAIAASGKADFKTAFFMARTQYVFRKPPKSTDGPAMIALHEEAKAAVGFRGELPDELATACLAVAHSINMSLDLFIKGWRDWNDGELLVSGGGIQNKCMMRSLNETLTNGSRLHIAPLDADLAQAKEAIAFALLAAATLDGLPSNVPSCTGAKHHVLLGSITPTPIPSNPHPSS